MADKDLLADAREQFRLASEASSENRTDALDDIRFARMAEQWDDSVKRQREREGRPCLTINRLPAFGRRVVNEARQNRPCINVLPASDQSDVTTAEVITGLIRNIEACSDADVAYDTAIEAAVFGGFGYYRVDVDYAHDDAFDLDIGIRRIANPFSVYGDHRSTAADSSDWNYGFVTEMLSKDEFEAKYKGADLSSFDLEKDGEWFTGESVRVAEWWVRDEVTRPIVQLADGTVLEAEQYLKNKPMFDMAGIAVKGERETKSFKVTQRIVTGSEVLDEVKWAGRFVPLVPVYGDEVIVEGKRYFRSLIRDAKPAQQQFNFWRTAATEMVALAPKVPYIGPRGAFTTDADKWNTINRVSHSFIEYDGPQPPTRQPLDGGAAAGALQEAMNASDDMKSVLGLFDPAMGAQSNEVSGVAIRRRQRQSEVGTFHFVDNLARSQRHCGRILLDLIPQIYTAERVVRILGEDGRAQNVKIGPQGQMPQGMPPQAMPGPMPPGMPPQGMPPGAPPPNADAAKYARVFDLTVGKYDVVVKSGPAYSTRREEAVEQQIAFLQAAPAVAPMMMDLVAGNLDWPQSDKLRERLEQQMANPPPNPELVKAQAQAQSQMQIEQAKVQAQAQLKQIEAQTQAQIEQVKAQGEAQKAQLLAEVDLMKARAQADIDLQVSSADNEAKAQIEREKLASSERQTAAKIEADRQNQMLALAAGILSARERVRGQNLNNGTTLDQTGAAVDSTNELQGAIGEIATAAGSMEAGGMIPRPPEPPVLAQSATKRKRRSRFAKQPDGSWLAEDL